MNRFSKDHFELVGERCLLESGWERDDVIGRQLAWERRYIYDERLREIGYERTHWLENIGRVKLGYPPLEKEIIMYEKNKGK